MPRKTKTNVNIVTHDSNTLNIRNETRNGIKVHVAEDILMGILLMMGQIKELLEEIKENSDLMIGEEEEDF